MKYIIILVWLADPIILPFTPGLSCAEQGNAGIEAISSYVEQSETQDQGWYTPEGKLIYGFYCE